MEQNMKTYQHTQNGTVIIEGTLAMALLMTLLGTFWLRPFLFSVPLVLVATWVFHSLTIEIERGRLRWRFGPGLITKTVMLDEITSVRCVRINAAEGWGIHFSRFGWLYNVSGWDAVAIELRSGKRFALGTDDPENLCAIIQQNLR
jgi:hypothetical protein